MTKLSLTKILEDIDLSKAKMSRHPFFDDITESPIIGLYAFAQAYNKIVYKGVISAPPLNINQISGGPDQKTTGKLNFSKNSFKINMNPQSNEVSIFGNEGTEHDIIHIITTNLAKNFARLRPDGQSKFNKQGHHMARSGTPAEMRAPDPGVFGNDNFSELGQYGWEETVGNHLNNEIRSSILSGLAVDPARVTKLLISTIKRIYTPKDNYRPKEGGTGIPEQFKTKLITLCKEVVYNLLMEYNKLLRIYKHSAMVQQGMKNPNKAVHKRQLKDINKVYNINDDEDE